MEGVCGAAAGVLTEWLFYGLDSYKVRTQAKAAGKPQGLSGLFRGAGPVALLGSAPSFGIFFAVYSPLLERVARSGAGTETAAMISSALAMVPSSLIVISL